VVRTRGTAGTRLFFAAVASVALVVASPGGVAHAKTKAAASDFDGDGFADLAVAAPGEAIGDVERAGLVSLLYSSKIGPVSNDNWDRSSEGIEGGPHTDASLGVALASGDFDGDEFDDLAIGAPGDTVGGHSEAGSVTTIGGSEHGLGGKTDRLLTQRTAGITGDPEAFDHFGAALAAGDFDGDGYDDLAIGAPNEKLNDKKDAGNVTVVYGSPNGLRATGSLELSQATKDLFGDVESGDRFGNALAAGNVDDDRYDDLVIGVPGEDIGSKGSSGAVAVLLGNGRAFGARFDESRSFSQADDGVPGGSESDDRFGEALALGDVDEDSYDDVIIGAPGESVGAASSAGAITVLFGSADGTQAEGAQAITQASKGVPSAAERDDRFGRAVAAGDIDDDGAAEVVVGAPGEGAGDADAAGSATVLTGTRDGLTTSGARLLYQGKNGVPGRPGADELFGNAVRAIDLNDDDRAEVIVGAPGEGVGPHPDGGTITILRGTRDGLATSDALLISQDTDSVEGDAEDGDLFGFTLG
jgi:hypothetical protein